jgi:Ca2+-binding EF-hand superfamily protein
LVALDSKYARVLACENFLLDAHLNMRELAHELFDTQDTGYVSLVRINESLAAFGQKELSTEDQAKMLELYTSHRFSL